MNVREKLVELFYDNNVRCNQKIEDLVNDVIDIITHGVTVSDEIEELRADNNRLRNMWAKAVSDLSKATANGVTVQEWIPVSELPQESGEYVVMLQDERKPTTLWYSKQLNGWYEFEDDDYLFDYKNVTHWQPLPQPPKGE